MILSRGLSYCYRTVNVTGVMNVFLFTCLVADVGCWLSPELGWSARTPTTDFCCWPGFPQRGNWIPTESWGKGPTALEIMQLTPAMFCLLEVSH